MTKDILINRSIAETRMALCENDKVREIRLYRDHMPSYVGAIYLGRVTKLSSEFQAAFIDLGNGLNGFLPLKNLPKTLGKKPSDLTELLQEGQRIIVQVSADAEQGKLIKLTGRIEIISTSIVLHPLRAGAFVSSRIKDPDKRAELKEFGQNMNLDDLGITFRTDAGHIPLDHLQKNISTLINEWQTVTGSIKSMKCPSLIMQGPDAVGQILREFATSDIENIIVDHAETHKEVTFWVKKFAPNLMDKISLYKAKEKLFDQYEINDELEKITAPKIELKSGAWITIETTEAMTVIDVNMGDALFSNDREKQIFKVNQEAAREIFYQLRLRAIGGLIVIDFIDMTDKGQVKSFLHYIDELINHDPMPVQRSNISAFGLLELTRKSQQYNLNNLLIEKTGIRKNLISQCMDILRDAENEALSSPGQTITLKTTDEIKRWLEKNNLIFDDFLKRTGSPLKIEVK